MLPTCLAIVNASTASPLSAALTPEWLAGLAAALAEQANKHIGPEWSVGVGMGVRVSDGTDLQTGEYVMSLVDGGPSNALGWHDEEGTNLIVGYVDVSLESTLEDVSQTASHEMAEMLRNPFGNLWVDDGVSREYPHELCDAVETNRYQASNGYTLSDFLLQSFFDSLGVAPFSFLQERALMGDEVQGYWPAGPLQTAAGGYQAARDSGSNYVTILGYQGDAPFGRQGERVWRGTHGLLTRTHRLLGVPRTPPDPNSPAKRAQLRRPVAF